MPISEIRVSGRFERQYKKLPQKIKVLAKEKESIFRFNPFDQRLDTHKLRGKDRDLWAFSVTDSFRIKFAFAKESVVLFLEIGTHEIYK